MTWNLSGGIRTNMMGQLGIVMGQKNIEMDQWTMCTIVGAHGRLDFVMGQGTTVIKQKAIVMGEWHTMMEQWDIMIGQWSMVNGECSIVLRVMTNVIAIRHYSAQSISSHETTMMRHKTFVMRYGAL